MAYSWDKKVLFPVFILFFSSLLVMYPRQFFWRWRAVYVNWEEKVRLATVFSLVIEFGRTSLDTSVFGVCRLCMKEACHRRRARAVDECWQMTRLKTAMDTLWVFCECRLALLIKLLCCDGSRALTFDWDKGVGWVKGWFRASVLWGGEEQQMKKV